VVRAYLGLGTNLGDRQAAIREALEALVCAGARVTRLSPLYETEPWGFLDQPRFINAACEIDTSMGPLALLHLCKCLERVAGRVATVRNGPRPLDLDILMYGDIRIRAPQLTVPHPGMLSRATVLVPLADIAAHVRHPLTGKTIGEHLSELAGTSGVAPYPPGLSL